MKYLENYRLSVEKPTMESYFKSEINWKFFNYLQDKLVKYEDAGDDITLLACVKMKVRGDFLYVYVYSYDTNDKSGYNISNENVYRYIEAYEEFGLFFRVYRSDLTAGSHNDELSKKFVEEFYQDVKNKCDRYNWDGIELLIAEKFV